MHHKCSCTVIQSHSHLLLTYTVYLPFLCFLCREKYLNTLLQVEMMLKLWFPQISAQPVSAASSVATSPTRSLQDTSSSTPPHKHRDQLHIPVKVRALAFPCVQKPTCTHKLRHHKLKLIFTGKLLSCSFFQKRRLSWTGTDSPAPSPIHVKCPRISAEEKSAKHDPDEREGPAPSPSLASDPNQKSPDVAGNSQLNDGTKGKDSDGEEPGKLSKYKAGQSSEPSLTWVHVAPIPSPRKACLAHEGTAAVGNSERTPSRRCSPATQDSSISSTTPHKSPKNLKKPTRCQSQPVAGQQSETTETCQGQSQPPHVTL